MKKLIIKLFVLNALLVGLLVSCNNDDTKETKLELVYDTYDTFVVSLQQGMNSLEVNFVEMSYDDIVGVL